MWPKGGPSTGALALERLRQARQRRKCQPQWVRFDAWYAAKRLLTRLQDSGGYCVCQLQTSRLLEGVALHADCPSPSWHAIGPLSSGLQGLVVRHRRKYAVTKRLTRTAPEVRAHSCTRQEVEEVSRVLKSQRSLAACPVGSRRRGADPGQPQPRAQEHHSALCLVASLVVERERLEHGVSWRKFKRHLILKGSQVALPALERVRKAA